MGKVAVVNISYVLDKSKRAGRFGQDLQAAAQDWQRKMQVAEQLLKQIQQKTERVDPSKMDEMLGLERERRMAEMDINSLKERSEVDLSLKAQRFQAQVADEIAPILTEYAEKNDIDVILNAPGAHILYAAKPLDVTQAVLDIYDSRGPK